MLMQLATPQTTPLLMPNTTENGTLLDRDDEGRNRKDSTQDDSYPSKSLLLKGSTVLPNEAGLPSNNTQIKDALQSRLELGSSNRTLPGSLSSFDDVVNQSPSIMNSHRAATMNALLNAEAAAQQYQQPTQLSMNAYRNHMLPATSQMYPQVPDVLAGHPNLNAAATVHNNPQFSAHLPGPYPVANQQMHLQSLTEQAYQRLATNQHLMKSHSRSPVHNHLVRPTTTTTTTEHSNGVGTTPAPAAPSLQNNSLDINSRKRQLDEIEETLFSLQKSEHDASKRHRMDPQQQSPSLDDTPPLGGTSSALSSVLSNNEMQPDGNGINPYNMYGMSPSPAAILDYVNKQRLMSISHQHQLNMIRDAEMEELLKRHISLSTSGLVSQQQSHLAGAAAGQLPQRDIYSQIPYMLPPNQTRVTQMLQQQQQQQQQQQFEANRRSEQDKLPALTDLKSTFVDNNDDYLKLAAPKKHFSIRPYMHLGTNTDEIWLSRFLSFLRAECIEVFTATPTDVFERKTSKKIHIHQVGLRCRFCAHMPYRARVVRSSCFPSSISRIYQSLTMMIREHFSRCQEMPAKVREQYTELKWMTKKGEIESKSHWIESAKSMGMVDTEKGILLNKPVKLTFPTASDSSPSTSSA